MRKTFTIQQELVARFANALAHPARVSICEFLGRQKTSYFGAIQEVIPLAKATVSQHLSVLKEAGLIQGEIMPPRVRYCIDVENWKLAKRIFGDFLESCVTDMTNCDESDYEPCYNSEEITEEHIFELAKYQEVNSWDKKISGEGDMRCYCNKN